MSSYNPGENFLTPAEVADVYRISRSTVYRMIGDGSLPAFRIRGQIRVARNQVDALLQEQGRPMPTLSELAHGTR